MHFANVQALLYARIMCKVLKDLRFILAFEVWRHYKMYICLVQALLDFIIEFTKLFLANAVMSSFSL